MRAKHFLLAFWVFALLLVVSCKNDDESPAPTTTTGTTPSPAELVATWTFQSTTLNGDTVALSVALEWLSNTVSAEVTIGADGSFVYREWDNTGTQVFSGSGTASVSGQSITITTNMVNGIPVTPESQTGTWSVSGNQLTLTLVEGSITIVFVLTK